MKCLLATLCGTALATADRSVQGRCRANAGLVQGWCHRIPCVANLRVAEMMLRIESAMLEVPCSVTVQSWSCLPHTSNTLCTLCAIASCLFRLRHKSECAVHPTRLKGSYTYGHTITSRCLPARLYPISTSGALLSHDSHQAHIQQVHIQVTNRCLPACLYLMSPSEPSHHSHQAHIHQVNKQSDPQMHT